MAYPVMTEYEVIAVDSEGHIVFCNDIPDAERTIKNEAYEESETLFVDWDIYKIPADITNTEAVHLCEVVPDGKDIDDYHVKHVATAHPPEPDCPYDKPHVWTATYEKEGGLEENPGVFGHGGGVILNQHCAKCGMKRIRDTWATNPNDGSEGHVTLQYIASEED